MASETSKNILHELVKKINNNSLQLASLPEIIVKVNTVLSDDRKGINDIVKVIQHELALSSRIIQIANSPALRGNRDITSMNDAINRLGISLIKNLAICVSLKDRFNSKNLLHKDIMDEELRISNSRSVHGFMIAKYIAVGLSPETSLIAGLVSKIGQVVVIRYISDHPELRLLTTGEVRTVINEIGDEVGDIILRKWEFPAAIINAIYGRAGADLINPTTYRDVFMLVDSYLKFTNIVPEVLPNYDVISEILAANKEDLDSLESILI